MWAVSHPEKRSSANLVESSCRAELRKKYPYWNKITEIKDMSASTTQIPYLHCKRKKNFQKIIPITVFFRNKRRQKFIELFPENPVRNERTRDCACDPWCSRMEASAPPLRGWLLLLCSVRRRETLENKWALRLGFLSLFVLLHSSPWILCFLRFDPSQARRSAQSNPIPAQKNTSLAWLGWVWVWVWVWMETIIIFSN